MIFTDGIQFVICNNRSVIKDIINIDACFFQVELDLSVPCHHLSATDIDTIACCIGSVLLVLRFKRVSTVKLSIFINFSADVELVNDQVSVLIVDTITIVVVTIVGIVDELDGDIFRVDTCWYFELDKLVLIGMQSNIRCFIQCLCSRCMYCKCVISSCILDRLPIDKDLIFWTSRTYILNILRIVMVTCDLKCRGNTIISVVYNSMYIFCTYFRYTVFKEGHCSSPRHYISAAYIASACRCIKNTGCICRLECLSTSNRTILLYFTTDIYTLNDKVSVLTYDTITIAIVRTVPCIVDEADTHGTWIHTFWCSESHELIVIHISVQHTVFIDIASVGIDSEGILTVLIDKRFAIDKYLILRTALAYIRNVVRIIVISCYRERYRCSILIASKVCNHGNRAPFSFYIECDIG